MAILNGIFRKMKGSAGSFTFRNNQKRTIVSEKITKTTDRKTAAQLKIRMKWGNIIQMYKGIIPLLQCAFENKADGVSDYNMFVKFNMQQTPVYLTKQEVAAGACVVAPYIISQGSLPAIVVSGTGANGVTDINLGNLTIGAATTVAQFANAVVANNEDYNYGDQISFFRVEQRVNATTGIPYGVFKAHDVVLDKSDTALLLAKVPAEGFTVVSNKLGHLSTVTGDYAYAWVHSRRKNGDIKVSSQTLIVNNSILASYTSDEAYADAVESYGGDNSVFLAPNNVSGSNTGNSGSGGSGSGQKTLTLSVSPANAGTVTGAGQYAAGASASITATAASGYTFSKWSDNNTNATRTVTMNDDMSLTAQFTVTGGGDNEGGGYA